jgi:hypothetical protein
MVRESILAKAVEAALVDLDHARNAAVDGEQLDAVGRINSSVDILRGAMAAERRLALSISDAVEAVCNLQGLVAEHVLDHRVPNDCFCTERAMTYRSSGAALAFIEQAVREALSLAVARRAGRAVRSKLLEAREEASAFTTQLRRLAAARREMP